MKFLAVNGSPRKNKNTGKLLEQIMSGAQSQGAEAELVHLRDLQYTGCISCFACKRIGGPSYGRCAVKDGLQHVLQKAHEADVLILGTPIYMFAETAFMRAFQERLWFLYFLYSNIKPPLSPKKKATALVYTMNCREEQIAALGMNSIINTAKLFMERLFAHCEIFLSCVTSQFDDYSKYDTDMWDAPVKQTRHVEVFPQELRKAYELGARLAG
jgi:multimeric flavodoxin WrbA